MNKKQTSADLFITPEFFNTIDEPQAKFIFEHTEKQLKDSLEANALIVTRISSLATITVTAMVALTGFSINRWDVNHHFWDPLLCTSTAAIVYLFMICVLITIMLLPAAYQSMGTEPKPFFVKEFINENSKSTLLKQLYTNEIQAYQSGITLNKKTNTTRWLLFKIIIALLVLSPIVFFGLTLYFNRHPI